MDTQAPEQPTVDILLSLYRPRLDYLAEQLESLAAQDYENLRLLVHDDCPEEPVDRAFIEEHAGRLPVEFVDSDENLGYAAAFDLLTAASAGDFVAYCDQDDLWEPTKVSRSVDVMEQDGTDLVACGYCVIDGDGHVVEAKDMGSRALFHGGEALRDNVFITMAQGCRLVACGDFARGAVPAAPFAHDKWLISCALLEDGLSLTPEPLLRYRRWGGNVSSILPGINSRQDFLEQRGGAHWKLTRALIDKYGDFEGSQALERFARARAEGDAAEILKGWPISPQAAAPALAASVLPEPLFMFLVRQAQARSR